MNSIKIMALVLVLLPTSAIAQKKAKKPSVPEVFDHARFVYVEAVGGDEFKPGLLPEDRVAIADIRDALQRWGRYTFTTERDKADLVFVVRKGRLASADLGAGSIGGRDSGGGALGGSGRGGSGMGAPGMDMPNSQGTQYGGPPRGAAVGVGGEAGPEDDLLEVCQIKPNGKLSSPLWSRSMQNGLNPPRLFLFMQFKEAVEKSYPRPAPAQPSKP